MYSFPELIKEIRKEANLTQAEFARFLKVSTVLVSMIESGQKEVSKKLLIKLADKMDVHPFSITPFLFSDIKNPIRKQNKIEKMFIRYGEKMQNHLIKNRAKKIKSHANK